MKLPDKPPQFPEKPTLKGIQEFNTRLERWWFDTQTAIQRSHDQLQDLVNQLTNNGD
jgi:hypothetical protein